MVFTVRPESFSNAGIRTSRSPESCVLVVVARMIVFVAESAARAPSVRPHARSAAAIRALRRPSRFMSLRLSRGSPRAVRGKVVTFHPFSSFCHLPSVGVRRARQRGELYQASMTPGSALRPVDRLEVCVVVDNVLDLLSTVPQSVTPELPNLLAAGATVLS